MALTLQDFTYPLPPTLIAQQPAHPRDAARLMVLNRQTQTISHHRFKEISRYLNQDDVLVLNETKVFPARLFGQKNSGGRVELLLLKQTENNCYDALSKPGLKVGQLLFFPNHVKGTVIKVYPTGEVNLAFGIGGTELLTFLATHGLTPLPPYLKKILPEKKLRITYQTVYASITGSAAAPTAGLHFTQRLLTELRNKGVTVETITLHVGLGTFQRLRHNAIAENRLHQETYYIHPATATRLLEAKQAGKRIIAVGTTSTRALESAAFYSQDTLRLKSGWQETTHFIYPPYRFAFIDGLITNFHLSQSSLLTLVAAFTSTPNTPYPFTRFSESFLGKAYETAMLENYRFFSFGDAMLIL